MGKADYNHDYYRDLDLDPTADEADIKKQYKKLALLYHPDRNLGNEEAASRKFQLINAASEILLDPKERSKYDMYRNPRPSYGAGYSGASGVRGNPYADMASKTNAKYGPPPSRTGPPPRSKGASNYDKFARATPTQSAFQAAQEGPEARKATWNAWERMHHPTARNDQGPFRSRMSDEFPSSTSQSTRPESGARRRPVPPPRSGAFDEYRDTNSSPRKNPNMNNSKPFSQSTNMPPPVPNRKGFMPNTPGAGDEPPAPRGAYFTQRDKPTAPPPPPREPTSTRYADADPLKQFKAKSHAVPDPEFTMEGRISTPYANHGGERIDPFESTNLNRSNSSKETKEASKGQVPRTGSDSNLNKPSRSRSYAEPKATRRASTKQFHPSISSDSDDDFVTMNSSRSSTKRATGSSTTRKVPETFDPHANTGKPLGKISRFRQWMQENPGEAPPPNGFPPDGPPLRSDQANSNNTQPNMYDNLSSPYNLRSNFANDLSAAPAFYYRTQSLLSKDSTGKSPAGKSNDFNFDDVRPVKFPDLKTNTQTAATSPSGAAHNWMHKDFVEIKTSLRSTFRKSYRPGKEDVYFQCSPLKSTKRTANNTSTVDCPTSIPTSHNGNVGAGCSQSSQTINIDNSPLGSPAKKSKPTPTSNQKKFKRTTENDIRTYFNISTESVFANQTPSSFSFNLANNGYNNPPPRPAGFSSSQENISTKFNSEDWAGKFQAGSGFANPNPNNAAMGSSTGPGRQRSKSTTRMRTKSPPKSSQGFMPQTAEPQQMESPGTKQFVPQQWDQQFSPDVFMPNGQTTPRPTRRKPSLRPTMGGKAAFVDDNSTSDEQPPHFSARKEDPRVSPPPIPTPEPMDIDTPPNTHTAPDIAPPPAPPKFNAKNLHIDAEKLKHPFASESHPQPNSGVADSLKVDFESLKVTELISTLEIPKAPIAPEFPADISTSDRPTLGAYSAYQQLFAKYMADWDLYDKSFLKHFVGRLNENEKLKEARWKDEEGTKTYRRGLEVDQEVLKMWMESKEKHAKALKGWQVMKEKMR